MSYDSILHSWLRFPRKQDQGRAHDQRQQEKVWTSEEERKWGGKDRVVSGRGGRELCSELSGIAQGNTESSLPCETSRQVLTLHLGLSF